MGQKINGGVSDSPSTSEIEVGCRPPGGNVGDTYRHADRVAGTVNNAFRYVSAEYRTQPPGGRLPTFIEFVGGLSLGKIRIFHRFMLYSNDAVHARHIDDK